MDPNNNKEIRNFISRLSHDDFARLLNIMGEEWGQILFRHLEPKYIDKVRKDLQNLNVPHRMLESGKSVAYFVAIATQRAQNKPTNR